MIIKKGRIANYKGEGSFLFFGDGKYLVDALQSTREITGVIFFMTKVEGISLKKKEKQVVSKKRVFGHGEVYTANREVNAMLDLVKQETERIESRFLEPAYGTGNFLSEVLNRKLHFFETRYDKSQLEYERYSGIAVSCIYRNDILEDNVVECQNLNFALPGARIHKLKPSKPMTIAEWNAKPQKKGCLNV